ncbi:MAG: type II secretion system F family protein, partial [Acidobacteria bacterium]|nr:type II secretion system F family protein [Acidobacteriota bacterium]
MALNNGSDVATVFTVLVCAGGFGFLLPDRVLKPLIKARSSRIRRAVPAALDLMVLSVEAGQSLNLAVLDAANELRESYPDLAAELAQVHLELRAGKSRQDALYKLGQRNQEPELRKLANVLIDADRFGSSLGPALRTHAKYLRNRMKQQAQETARRVAVKLVFPVFFLIFPSVLLVTLGPAVIKMTTQLKGFIGDL